MPLKRSASHHAPPSRHAVRFSNVHSLPVPFSESRVRAAFNRGKHCDGRVSFPSFHAYSSSLLDKDGASGRGGRGRAKSKHKLHTRAHMHTEREKRTLLRTRERLPKWAVCLCYADPHCCCVYFFLSVSGMGRGGGFLDFFSHSLRCVRVFCASYANSVCVLPSECTCPVITLVNFSLFLSSATMPSFVCVYMCVCVLAGYANVLCALSACACVSLSSALLL